MADPGSFVGRERRRPAGLRSPFYRDTSSFAITVDLGANASIATVSTYVENLSNLVDLGETWGELVARAAADWDLAYDIRRRGPRAIDDLLSEGNLGSGAYEEFYEWMHSIPPWRGWWPNHPAWTLLRDQRADEIRGRPPRVRRLRYQKPP